MDRPAVNADGSTDVYFGPRSPGDGKNWLATIPGKGYFVILRLYGPRRAFFDQTWKPGDIEKVKQSQSRCRLPRPNALQEAFYWRTVTLIAAKPQ